LSQEVRLQNRMLDQLENKIGDVQDHMVTLNERLKNTLEEVTYNSIVLLYSILNFIPCSRARRTRFVWYNQLHFVVQLNYSDACL
jgi:hypothetical protein